MLNQHGVTGEEADAITLHYLQRADGFIDWTSDLHKQGLDASINMAGFLALGAGELKGLYEAGKISYGLYMARRAALQTAKGPSKAGVEWSFRNIPEGGATITGRKYSEHALERMAPNTPEIRAELRTKADKIAGEKGLVPGSKEYNEFINKYVDPRGITPTVVEDAIRNTKPAPGNTPGTFVHENANVRVIVNSNGDVVTVIPR